MSVLVVDDSLTVRMDLVEALGAAGVEATGCATLDDARRALRAGGVRLLILDVLLPDGDGLSFLAEIRADPATAETAVLVLSTEAEVGHRIRGLQTGADEYVGKPYDTGHVVERVRQLLRRDLPETPALPTVLVIDDSPTVRESLRVTLEGAGYAVALAETGEDGLRLAERHRPAAIVVDGALPGIDGASVIRRVRLDAALRRTPCLLLTGSSGPGGELQALDAGADAFLRKDDDPAVLLARLAAVLRRSSAPAEAEGLLAPKKVLAVDDSATYLNALSDVLREDGYDVVLARSGEEALELLAVQPVDCILLDLLMPGLGGTETCKRIKGTPVLREIPLVMLTAVEDRGTMLEGLAAGADDYIAKSSEVEVLRARVRAQLRRRQFEDENRRIREELLRRELEASEARAARQIAEARAALVDELERKNRELEAFSYTVSHDLRAPLRGIDGFSQALLEDCGDRLDDHGRELLGRVRAAARRMGELIDDLLALSRIGRSELRLEPCDLSAMASSIVADLRRKHPDRTVEVVIAPRMLARADPGLLRVALENLIGNAWKFTARIAAARVEIATAAAEGGTVYVVRDNGAGFDMAYADKLFRPFQRLHRAAEFPGTGIGLATVHRIVERHGGRIRAESSPGGGATFTFSLGGDPP